LTLFGKTEHVPYGGICTAVREGETVHDVECCRNTVNAEARLAKLPNGILYGANSIHLPVTLPPWEGLDSVYQSREKTAIVAHRLVPAITVYKLRE
jgi:hypothetical protein